LNYRLPDVLCALGISQIKRLQDFKKQRNEIFNYYLNSLIQIDELRIPGVREYVSPMWHLYHIHVDPKHRKPLFDFLRANEIFVQVNYLPAYLHPVFSRRGKNIEEFKNSESFYQTEISIPIFSGLSDTQLYKVVQTIQKYFKL